MRKIVPAFGPEDLAALEENGVAVALLRRFGPLSGTASEREIAQTMLAAPEAAIRARIADLHEQIRWLEGWLPTPPDDGGRR